MVRVKADRWANGTRYDLRIDAAVEDVHGHRGGEVFIRDFTTMSQPKVIATRRWVRAPPTIGSPVQVEFDRNVDRASVEAAFRVAPRRRAFRVVAGRDVMWRPQGWTISAWYTVSLTRA